MPFTKPVPEWNNPGTEPPQSTKDNGWTAGSKPPADWFNWFFHLVYQALKELQDNGYNKDEITQAITTAVSAAATAAQNNLTAHASRTDNPHNTTKAQVGLGNVDNTSDVNKPVSTSQNAAITAAVNALKAITQNAKITADNGSYFLSVNSTEDAYVKLKTLPTGLHTVYIVSGATNAPSANSFKGLMITEPDITYGSIFGMDDNKNIYSNKLSNGTFTGWIKINDAPPDILSKLITVDGSGSSLDGDTVDGKHYSDIITAINTAIAALTKASVGLSNVDNTSDSTKPVSTAQAAADTTIYNNALNWVKGLGIGGIAKQLSAHADLNTLPAVTAIYGAPQAVNAPPRVNGDNSGIYHYIINIAWDTTPVWELQIAVEITTGTIFTRTKIDPSGWTAWKKLWSDGNSYQLVDNLGYSKSIGDLNTSASGFLYAYYGSSNRPSTSENFFVIASSVGSTYAQIAIGEVTGKLYIRYKNGSNWSSWGSYSSLLTTKITYYVDLINGFDTDDGLTVGTAFKTVQKALNVLPRILLEDVTIDIRGADQWINIGVVEIDGFMGVGEINFVNDTNGSMILKGLITGHGCTSKLRFDNLLLVSDTSLTLPHWDQGVDRHTVMFSRCDSVQFSNCGIDGSSRNTHGVYISEGHCLFDGGYISHTNFATNVNWYSTVEMYNVEGNDNNWAYVAHNASKIVRNSSVMSADNSIYTGEGGEVI